MSLRWFHKANTGMRIVAEGVLIEVIFREISGEVGDKLAVADVFDHENYVKTVGLTRAKGSVDITDRIKINITDTVPRNIDEVHIRYVAPHHYGMAYRDYRDGKTHPPSPNVRNV